MEKYPDSSGAREYHDVTPHNKPHIRYLLRGEKKKTTNKTVAAFAQVRNSKEPSRRQGLHRVSWGVGRNFSG